jgi:hypothetical protein
LYFTLYYIAQILVIEKSTPATLSLLNPLKKKTVIFILLMLNRKLRFLYLKWTLIKRKNLCLYILYDTVFITRQIFVIFIFYFYSLSHNLETSGVFLFHLQRKCQEEKNSKIFNHLCDIRFRFHPKSQSFFIYKIAYNMLGKLFEKLNVHPKFMFFTFVGSIYCMYHIYNHFGKIGFDTFQV